MATQKQIVNRLKRARGQLDGLIEQLENGDANCRDVLTQFAAVNSAISRASYLTVATIMSQCTLEIAGADGEGAGTGSAGGSLADGALADGTGADSAGASAGANGADSSTNGASAGANGAGSGAAAKPKQFVKTDQITIEELEKLFLSLA